MENGFITIHRKIMENPIWADPELAFLFINLLLLANHKEHRQLYKDTEIMVKRGQLITGRYKLAILTNLNPSKIYRYLMKLKRLKILDIESNNEFTLITILKYSDYQTPVIKSNSKLNNERTTSEHNTKNDNNVINNNSKELEQAQSYGNQDINEVIEYLKAKQDLKDLDGSVKWNRIYARNLLKKMGNDPTRVKRFIDYALNDPFHQKNATNIKYLYNNLGKIALQAKSKSQEVARI